MTRCRAQTEPIAAIVAVATIALVLGLYAGYVTDTLPGSSERAVESPALDRIWYDVETSGRYDGTDPSASLADDITRRALPEGFTVYVSVTAFEDGRERVIDDAYFGSDGDSLQLGSQARADLPPPKARVATRPVPVEVAPGDVRGGILRVEVWS